MSIDGTCPAFALGRGEDAGEELREHALARAVRPDYPEAFAARDGKVDTDQYGVIVEGHARLVEFDHLPPTPGPAAKFQPYLAALQHGAFDLVHAVDLALLVAGLLDVTFVYDQVGPELEAPDRLFEPCYLFLLRDIELLLPFELQLPRHGISRVVAWPGCDPPVFEFGDLLHRLVEQVAVVGDDDDRAIERADDRLQKLPAPGVEVGFWLVEEQDVGTPGEAGSQYRQLALPAAQIPHRTLDVAITETERPQVAA